jgi:hypothetical protein
MSYYTLKKKYYAYCTHHMDAHLACFTCSFFLCSVVDGEKI